MNGPLHHRATRRQGKLCWPFQAAIEVTTCAHIARGPGGLTGWPQGLGLGSSDRRASRKEAALDLEFLGPRAMSGIVHVIRGERTSFRESYTIGVL